MNRRFGIISDAFTPAPENCWTCHLKLNIMIPKIENGNKLFVEEQKVISPVDLKEEMDIEMTEKTANTADAKQKRKK